MANLRDATSLQFSKLATPGAAAAVAEPEDYLNLAATSQDTLNVSDSDTIHGGAEADILVGGADKDVLFGGGGDDIIVGGGLMSAALPEIQISLSEDTPNPNIIWLDRPHPTLFADKLYGGAGNDLLVGGSWNDEDGDLALEFSHVPGANVGEELILNFFENNLSSLGVNNVIRGGVGDDTLLGANGFDTLGGGDGDDIIYGFDGPDIIFGGAGDDLIFAGAGDPELFHREAGGGFTLVEEIFGGAGNDRIYGGDGLDHIYGGTGDDTIFGGDGEPHGNFPFDGSPEPGFVEQLRGGEGQDVIFGEGSADQIDGGDGSDTIDGGTDSDTIEGGSGDLSDDLLTGGSGRDYFVFSTNMGVDTVTDFDVEEDILDFRLFGASQGVEQLGVRDFVADILRDAEETTLGDSSGLFIDVGDGNGLFLVGLTLSDLDDLRFVAELAD